MRSHDLRMGFAAALMFAQCPKDATNPPPPATHLAFSQAPANTQAGAAISPPVTVWALDASNAIAAGFKDSIAIALATDPTGDTLEGAKKVAAVGGVATFSSLSVALAGTGYTLAASAAGLTGATSSAFNVTATPPPPATHLAFLQQPTNTAAGATITPAVTVRALDASNALVTTYADSVAVAISTNPGSGTLAGTRKVTAVSGVATFSTLSINNAGTGYTLAATAGGLTGATSGTFNVTAAAAVDTIFSDGFEGGSKALWDDDYLPTHQVVVTDGANSHSGTHYLRIDYPAGDEGGALSKFFLPGYDTVYARYYVKFPSTWQGGTKLILLRGSRTDSIYSSFGVAGQCPNGTSWFLTNVVTRDSASALPLRFYTYYVGMPTESDGVTCYGRYGDAATPPSTYYAPLTVSKNVWHLVEFEVILNTPGSSNGQQQMWLDGVLRGTWTGLNFRTSSILKLDAFTLEASMNETQGGSPQAQSLSVDDVLVIHGRRPGP